MALASSTCATAGSPATDTGAIEPHQNRPAMLEGCQAFIAGAPAMRAAIELIARTAPSTANVLITGEYGSGRRTVARAIHVGSPHALQPFVTIRPETIVENQFEADLFGGGADNPDSGSDATIGLLERADGGTLFIGEIAAIPQALQPRLLRAIETGEFERAGGSCTHRTNVRVLSASAVDLDAEVAAGRLRQDLLWRLATIEIRLPALRDRREDILPLANRFLHRYARRLRKPITGFDDGAREAMLAYRWPGNIRELDHVIERAVLSATGPTVCAADLGWRAADEQRLEGRTLANVEAYLIRRALARVDGNVSQAAKALGLSRSALYRRLERYEL